MMAQERETERWALPGTLMRDGGVSKARWTMCLWGSAGLLSHSPRSVVWECGGQPGSVWNDAPEDVLVLVSRAGALTPCHTRVLWISCVQSLEIRKPMRRIGAGTV